MPQKPIGSEYDCGINANGFEQMSQRGPIKVKCGSGTRNTPSSY